MKSIFKKDKLGEYAAAFMVASFGSAFLGASFFFSLLIGLFGIAVVIFGDKADSKN